MEASILAVALQQRIIKCLVEILPVKHFEFKCWEGGQLFILLELAEKKKQRKKHQSEIDKTVRKLIERPYSICSSSLISEFKSHHSLPGWQA